MTARPSPPKPHELAKGGTGSGGPAISRMTEFERARATSALRASAPASSFSSPTSAPGLPPRPGMTSGYGSSSYLGSSSTYGGYGSGYGGYGSSYGSSYGSRYGSTYGRYGSSYGGYGGGLGGYGSGYGGYGSGYGGYGSSYGGYGGYRGGMYGGRMDGPPMDGQMPDGILQRVGYVVDTFGRFSQLLDMNCDAIYGTFSSVLRVLESLSYLRREFFFVFQTWTFFRVLQLLVRKFNYFGQHMIGRTAGVSSVLKGDMLDLDSFSNFQDKTQNNIVKGGRSGALGWILFFVSIIIGPIIVNRLWRKLKESLPPLDSMDDAWGGAGMKATALYDFEPQSPHDLPFHKGDVIRILNSSDKSWWEGELNGRVGMLPSNYVEPVQGPQPEPKITQL